MDNQNSEASIKSIERIREYPIVKDSFTKAGEYYTWIKEKNSTLNNTLTWTENNIKNVIDLVEPIATPRLESVDNFACNQLDKMENKYPIIKESSENILKSSSEYYDSSIKPKVDKIVATKDCAVSIAMTPFRIASKSIDYLSSTTNSFVHRYLSRDNKGESKTIDRKEYDLLFGRALKELDIIRYYNKRTIESLSNVLSSIYEQTVTRNQEMINKYYQEYVSNVRSGSGGGDGNSSEDRSTELSLMEIVASLSSKLRVSVRALSAVCYSHISTSNQERLDLVFHKTEQMYASLSRATLADIRDQISVDNVKWIGQNTIGLLANVNAALVTKYETEIGAPPPLQAKVADSDDDGKDEVLYSDVDYSTIIENDN